MKMGHFSRFKKRFISLNIIGWFLNYSTAFCYHLFPQTHHNKMVGTKWFDHKGFQFSFSRFDKVTMIPSGDST